MRNVARAMAAVVPGFDQVEYPDWAALFDRWWREAQRGTVLALDEFPALVAVNAAIPSILQKQLDAHAASGPHLVLCGSSQRMMHGLVLESNAPLYGRAREIMRIDPLGAHWIGQALPSAGHRAALDAYAVWGGVPRYWELAAEHRSLRAAVRAIVLDPQGVLHDEPHRLLLDDAREVAQAGSILTLIGQGCHRISEIAARIGKPATSLTRPLARLVDLCLAVRDMPFGDHPRSARRTLYRIADPFLRFWFRFVEPNRSQLAARQIVQVERAIAPMRAAHTGQIWEELARASVAHLRVGGLRWQPAARWWGKDAAGVAAEIDIVAESYDRRHVLLGEAKLSVQPGEHDRIRRKLEVQAQRLPFVEGKKIVCAIWDATDSPRASDARRITAEDVFNVLL